MQNRKSWIRNATLKHTGSYDEILESWALKSGKTHPAVAQFAKKTLCLARPAQPASQSSCLTYLCRTILGESCCARRTRMASILRMAGPLCAKYGKYGMYDKYGKSEWWATHATYAYCDEAPPHMPSQAA